MDYLAQSIADQYGGMFNEEDIAYGGYLQVKETIDSSIIGEAALEAIIGGVTDFEDFVSETVRELLGYPGFELTDDVLRDILTYDELDVLYEEDTSDTLGYVSEAYEQGVYDALDELVRDNLAEVIDSVKGEIDRVLDNWGVSSLTDISEDDLADFAYDVSTDTDYSAPLVYVMIMYDLFVR